MLRYCVVFLFCLAGMSQARLLRIEVRERSDVLGGKSFGKAGPYERIAGVAYFAVDPGVPANRIICDIDKAPRNAGGLVEFSADIYLLAPADPARGNHALLFEVSNRGGKGMLPMFNRASGSFDPRADTEFGDGFLLEEGFTLAWLGWQWDVPRKPGLMRLHAPIATDEGRTITGPVRSEFVPDTVETAHSLADREHIPYPPVDPDDPGLVLTVRERNDGPRRPLPRGAWRIQNGTHIVMDSGFQPGRIYELVYTARDPVLVGLGPTAVRDLISHMKYSDTRRQIKHAYGFGVSQSGRFLRTFLYYGFNQDEKNRRAFDGIIAHVAGGGRGSFNHRFAQASRDGHPFMNFFYPTDIFPFTDAPQTDPETGLTGGLLVHAEKAGVVPKIFYTNASYEYYGRAASLIHTTLDGTRDVPPGPDTRIYLFSGGQHGPAAFPPVRRNTQNLPNPNDFRWSLRALLLRMHAWAAAGVAPPPSRYPRISAGELVPVESLRFPKLPGVKLPTRIQKAYRVDYNAGEPPKVGNPFPTLVPQVDADGNETSGVRMPAVAVPIAAYTGWNLRSPEIGAPDELYSMVGSWIPFSRAAIEARYASRSAYLKRVEAAARALVSDGFLLDRDVPSLVERSRQEWDYVHGSNN